MKGKDVKNQTSILKSSQSKSAIEDDESGTRRLNVLLTNESYKRLMVHCLMENESPGRLLSDLIDRNLTRWEIPEEVINPRKR